MLTARAERAAPRGIPNRAAQNPRVQLAARAASPAVSTSRRSCSCAASRSTASICARGGGPGRSANARSYPTRHRRFEGRACSPERRRVAVLSPYFPYPLSHGGAVRIYHLLREIAREFDVELFAFTEMGNVPSVPELAPVLEFCARVVLVEKPRYREPRWSTILPPEVLEFRSPAMRRAIAEERRAFGFERLQVEYTQLAAIRRRYSRGARRHVRPVRPDPAPRPHNRRMVGLVSLAPLRNSGRAPLPARRRDVEEGRADARPASPASSSRTESISRASARSRSATASGCSSSGPSGTFPNIEAYRFFTEQRLAPAARSASRAWN